MSIDLDTLAVSGQYLSRFGEQLANTGQNLLGASQNWTQQEQQRQKEQQQQQRTEQAAGDVFLDAQSFIEVSAATSYMNDSFLQFTDAMAVDSDYETTVRKWTDRKAQMEEDFASMLKLQRSKEKFVPSWQVKAFEYEEKVRETVRAKLGAKAEAAFAQGMEKFAKAGDVQGMTDYAVSAAQSGSVSHETVSLTNARMLPVANYNSVYKYLDELNTPEVAVSFLTDTTRVGGKVWYERWGLTTEQRDTMVQHFVGTIGTRDTLAKNALVEKAGKAWTAISTKWNATKPEERVKDREELVVALAQVANTTYATGVQGLLDKWDAVHGTGLEKGVERQQQSVEIASMNALYDWQKKGRPKGKEPWNPDKVAEMQAAGTVDKSQAERMISAWQAADAPDAVVDIESRLYAALQPVVVDKKVTIVNPALAVTDVDILTAYGKGTLGVGDKAISNYSHLMSLRGTLQKTYEDGINRTVASTEFAAGGVIYDPVKTPEQKRKWMMDNIAKFSSDDYSKWLGRIDPYNDDPERKKVINALSDFYGRASAGTDVSVAKKREYAIEEYAAKEAMENLMRKYPDNPEKWDKALATVLSDSVLQELERAIEAKDRSRFGVTAGVEAAFPMIAETAREREMMEEYPGVAGKLAVLGPKILEMEQKAIQAKGLTVAASTPKATSKGDTVYTDTKGNRYIVLSEVVGGKETNVVYQWNTTSEIFERMP